MASPSGGDGRAKPDWGSPSPRPGGGRRSGAATAKRGTPTAGATPSRRAAQKPGAQAKAKAKAGAGGRGARSGAGAATAPKAGKAQRAAKPGTAAAKGQKAKASSRRRPGSFHRRYGVVYDTDGPHVRLGIVWFVIALGALIAGSTPTAVVYGVVAAVAAAQVARAWRGGAPKPSPLMAAVGAGLITMGACFGAGGAGLGMLVAVGLAFAGATDGRSPNPRIADIGWTLQCALAPGIVGMSVVLLARLDQGSAIGLLLLASAYETGDYVIGSGSANPFEGPGAGAAGIVVVTFILSTLPISALSFGQAWVLGGSVALLAPAGQLLASALLPSADTPASGMRRLDSLLLAAPIWAWGVGLVLR